MNLNVKTLSIDTDRAVLIVEEENPVELAINLVRGNTYIFHANCYCNATSATLASYDTEDIWSLSIGSQYYSNTSPVVVVSDPTKWNNAAAYWTSANVEAGSICCMVNVNGTALTSDLGDLDSKEYRMEIVLSNNVSANVTVVDAKCVIANAVPITV